MLLLLARAEARGDGIALRHLGGTTPGWPFGYDEIEPFYQAAENLYQVRGTLGEDPTEPRHSGDYNFPPVPDEPAIADLRRRLDGRQTVVRAVTLLATLGKTEEQAYAQLRQMAMAWRISFEDAAARIVASRDAAAPRPQEAGDGRYDG